MSRNFRRRAVTATLVFGFIAAWAPASVFAHVEFEDAPTSIAPNSDIDLTMHVANEREAANFNVAIATRLPEGWTGVSCEEKPTWTCEIVTVSQRVEVHFTKDEGAAAAEDELFEFTLHSSDTLGTASFPTLQTYDTGEEVGWVGDPGSENPSPTLEVADPAATTTTVSAATTTAAPATTAAATTLAPATTQAEVTTTAAEAESTTTAVSGDTTVDTATILETTVTTAADSDDDDGNTGAILAVILLAIAAAIAGTIIYLRKRKPPTIPPAGAAPIVAETVVPEPGPLDPTIENPDLGQP